MNDAPTDGAYYRTGWRGWLDRDPQARLVAALSAHRLVHNRPLWWMCRGCRELRRGRATT